MNGRVEAREDLTLYLRPGDYGVMLNDNVWYARPPGDVHGLIANLSRHKVVEHEDGTITVSPSILVSGKDANAQPVSWHGFLEAGIWRQVS